MVSGMRGYTSWLLYVYRDQLQVPSIWPMDEVKTKIRTVPQGNQIIRGRGGKTNIGILLYRLEEDTASTLLLLLSLSNSK